MFWVTRSMPLSKLLTNATSPRYPAAMLVVLSWCLSSSAISCAARTFWSPHVVRSHLNCSRDCNLYTCVCMSVCLSMFLIKSHWCITLSYLTLLCFYIFFSGLSEVYTFIFGHCEDVCLGFSWDHAPLPWGREHKTWSACALGCFSALHLTHKFRMAGVQTHSCTHNNNTTLVCQGRSARARFAPKLAAGARTPTPRGPGHASDRWTDDDKSKRKSDDDGATVTSAGRGRHDTWN